MKLRNQILIGLVALGGATVASADPRVIVGHFAPFADTLEGTAVNVVVNGNTALEGVQFNQFTDYIELTEGMTTVDIVPVGATEPAISGEFMLAADTDYTLFATGDITNQPLALIPLADNNDAPADGNIKIRVFHAAPFAAELADTEVSIRTAGGDIVGGLQGVPFGVGSDYLELPAGTYDLKVASNDGTVNYIDPLPVDLAAGTIATLFAVGDGANQPLGITAVPVGALPLRAPVTEDALGIFQLKDADGNVLTGSGFNFSPIASQNRVVGNWFVYDEAGEPTFLVFDSEAAGYDGMMSTAKLFSSSGTPEPVAEEIGSIVFGVVDCRTIMASVTVGDAEAVDYEGTRLSPNASCPAPVAPAAE